jgi:hypothetical protein
MPILSPLLLSFLLLLSSLTPEEEIKIERGVVSHQYKIYYRAEMKCEGRRRMKERKKEEEERPQNQN